jgi:signal peptidase II
MTKEIRNRLITVSSITLGILLIDQISKIWVKTHFVLGESVQVTNWFYIAFIENNGMAFGAEFFDKMILSVLRIIAVGFIGYYLYRIIKKQYRTRYIIAFTLIFAGAIGNIIDGTFYGIWFDSSAGQLAHFLPENGGYAPLLYGKVVDMLYFPIIDTTWPSWMPFIGGKEFSFFDPVFNIADSAVCIGVFIILLFERNYMNGILKEKNDNNKNEENSIEKNENNNE